MVGSGSEHASGLPSTGIEALRSIDVNEAPDE